ncbi:hypothetical protein Tco_0390223 [Tanacetum coccineum]
MSSLALALKARCSLLFPPQTTMIRALCTPDDCTTRHLRDSQTRDKQTCSSYVKLSSAVVRNPLLMPSHHSLVCDQRCAGKCCRYYPRASPNVKELPFVSTLHVDVQTSCAGAQSACTVRRAYPSLYLSE